VVATPDTSRQPSDVANSRTMEAWRDVDRNAHVCQCIIAGWADRYLSFANAKESGSAWPTAILGQATPVRGQGGSLISKKMPRRGTR
jgi:hypothetical protein